MRLGGAHCIVALLVTQLGCAAISGFGSFEKCEGPTCDTSDAVAIDTSLEDSARPDESVDTLVETSSETPGVDTANDTLVEDVPVTDSGSDVPSPDTTPIDTGTLPDSGGCGGTAGPTMVSLGSFCIDSTEVTNAHYASFLAAKGTDLSGQPAVCSWNTTYTPSSGWPAISTEANLPVMSVDWCDAYMFCKWAGKRLCGAIGGGAAAFGSYANPTVNAWYYACSANGTKVYPYGNVYDATACDGVDIKPNRRVAVGTMTGCVGGYPGLHDLSGNVYEWEDSCDGTTGGADNCRIRGGGIYSPSDYLKCSVDRSFARNTADDNRGIRCCSL